LKRAPNREPFFHARIYLTRIANILIIYFVHDL
jgi:hypothetical protein